MPVASVHFAEMGAGEIKLASVTFGKLKTQGGFVFEGVFDLELDDVFLPPGGERNRGLISKAMPAVADPQTRW